MASIAKAASLIQRPGIATTLGAVLLSISLAGCNADEPYHFVSTDDTKVPLDTALQVADRQAVKALEEGMTDPKAQLRPLGPDGEPLALADYSRKLSLFTFEKRPVLYVSYECRKPLGYLGGWTHFSIWVFLDTQETKFFGGM